jgi:hypothetical protein
LLHGRPEVIGAAFGELLGHQPELGTGRGAEVAERAWAVQPVHKPAPSEHHNAIVVAGPDPAARAQLDAVQLAGDHRDGVIQRGRLDAVHEVEEGPCDS